MENLNLNKYSLAAPRTNADVLVMLDRSLMLAAELKQLTADLFKVEETTETA